MNTKLPDLANRAAVHTMTLANAVLVIILCTLQSLRSCGRLP